VCKDNLDKIQLEFSNIKKAAHYGGLNI